MQRGPMQRDQNTPDSGQARLPGALLRRLDTPSPGANRQRLTWNFGPAKQCENRPRSTGQWMFLEPQTGLARRLLPRAAGARFDREPMSLPVRFGSDGNTRPAAPGWPPTGPSKQCASHASGSHPNRPSLVDVDHQGIANAKPSRTRSGQ